MHRFVRAFRGHTPSAPGMTVAVTGGTGFIGGAVIRRLLQAGLRVKALVRPAAVSACFNSPRLSWIRGDLRRGRALQRLVNGTHAVIHCAGSVRGISAADFAPANVAGVANMVQAVQNTDTSPRFLLISSLAAGAPELSAYAASKRMGETVLRSAEPGFAWTILRPPAVYGPGDRELMPLLRWLRHGLLFVPKAGGQRFSLIFITDLAEAVWMWLTSGAGDGGCFELHDGKKGGYCWEDVRKTAADLYGRRIHCINVPPTLVRTAARLNTAAARAVGYRPMLTPGKVEELCHADWSCENTRFSRTVRWRPAVDLHEGLQCTLGVPLKHQYRGKKCPPQTNLKFSRP